MQLIKILKLWDSVIVLCFVVRNFMSILVLQSSLWGRESWLLYLVFLVSGDCCAALLSMPQVCLQFVIVVFPDHTHYFSGISHFIWVFKFFFYF